MKTTLRVLRAFLLASLVGCIPAFSPIGYFIASPYREHVAPMTALLTMLLLLWAGRER